jgi:flagellar hook-associated protein 1 FlgK
MIGITAGLEVARKALSAYQLAISVYGNNIANVETPGFSRQRPIFQESGPVTYGFGRVGLGVDTETIRRMRDVFLDTAYWDNNASYAKYESMEQNLREIEMVFGEPSDVGLGSAIQEFWDSWQELANQPESITARTLVVGSATSLCDSLGRLDSQLKDLRSKIDLEIQGYVAQINSLADRIAALNGSIVRAECSGNEASDLRDKRDLLIDELSQIVNVKVFESADGSAAVKIGTEALVERMDTIHVSAAMIESGGQSVSEIRLNLGSRAICPAGGRLAGLLESRDEIIPRYMANLDELAGTLVEAVNEVHRSGFGLDGLGGRDFFVPSNTTAASICVAGDIVSDPGLIAASADGSQGNNNNALAIAGLRLESLFGDSNATSEEYYSSIVGALGIEAARAANDTEAQDLLVEEIATRRESVKGVSIDEEMTNLVASQHAYQAAVKLVSVIDELMGSVMDMV